VIENISFIEETSNDEIVLSADKLQEFTPSVQGECISTDVKVIEETPNSGDPA